MDGPSVYILGPRTNISMDNVLPVGIPRVPLEQTNQDCILCLFSRTRARVKGNIRVARLISVSPRNVELVIGFHRYQESMTSCDTLVEKVDPVWVSRQTNQAQVGYCSNQDRQRSVRRLERLDRVFMLPAERVATRPASSAPPSDHRPLHPRSPQGTGSPPVIRQAGTCGDWTQPSDKSTRHRTTMVYFSRVIEDSRTRFVIDSIPKQRGPDEKRLVSSNGMHGGCENTSSFWSEQKQC